MNERPAGNAARTLLLWRHAKSAWDDPNLADFDRPLAPRGRRAGPQMAAWLAERWQPDLVYCSPARRTRETWQFLAPLLPEATPVITEPRIYEAEWAALLDVIHETDASAATVLMIGHNPGFEDLSTALLGPSSDELPPKFPTAACAALALDAKWSELATGEATLQTFQTPKALQLD